MGEPEPEPIINYFFGANNNRQKLRIEVEFPYNLNDRTDLSYHFYVNCVHDDPQSFWIDFMICYTIAWWPQQPLQSYEIESYLLSDNVLQVFIERMTDTTNFEFLDEPPQLVIVDNNPEESAQPASTTETETNDLDVEQWEEETGTYIVSVTAPYWYDAYPDLRYQIRLPYSFDGGTGHLVLTVRYGANDIWDLSTQPDGFQVTVVVYAANMNVTITVDPIPDNFTYDTAIVAVLQPGQSSTVTERSSAQLPEEDEPEEDPEGTDDTRTPPPWPKPRVVLTAAGNTTYTMTLKSEYYFDDHPKIQYRLEARFGSNQETLTIVVYHLDEGDTHQWAYQPVQGQFEVQVTLSEPRVMIVRVTNTIFTFISSKLEVLVFHPIVIPPEYLPKTHLSKELLPRAEPAVRVCFTSGPLKEWSFYVSKRIFEKALCEDRYTMAAIFNAYLVNQCPEAASFIPTLDEAHPEGWDCVYWKVSFPNQYLFCL
jgi:hypothetical protein